jgi:hypothetical protein
VLPWRYLGTEDTSAAPTAMFSRFTISQREKGSTSPAGSPFDAVANLRLAVADDLSSYPDPAWADEECLKRYLRARDQNVEKAAALLQATLKWRTENGIHKWLPARSAPCWPVLKLEAATGKMFVLPEANSKG